MSGYDLDKAIRKVPDFPKPGILFYDITTILTNPEAFRHTVDSMAEFCRFVGFDAIAAVEARGFLFAAPLAHELDMPLILVRKKGKLPGKTVTKTYDLEYGQDSIQIHKDDIPRGGKVLLLDDLVATGGTLKAAAELLEEGGALVPHAFCVVGLPFLGFREAMAPVKVTTLIDYDSE